MTSIFEKLKKSKTVAYEYDGETIEFTLNTLTVSDVAEIEELDTTMDKLEIVRKSLLKQYPDITMDDVGDIPVSIATKLIEDIMEFNDLTDD